MNKFKVGDKVKTKLGGQVLTIKEIKGNRYRVEENVFSWSDEHLFGVGETKKVEEQFEVGNVLYTDRDDKVTLLELAWRVKFENGKTGFRRFSQLRREAPLKEITEKELAEIGYVIKK